MTNDLFNSVAMPRIPSNTFDLGHEVKMSFNIGWLTPSCVVDCIPGDVFRITPETMLRFAPLVAPVMHRVDVYTHYFFVPYRILWSGFEDFIANPDSDIVAPFVTIDSADGYVEKSVADYLGIPPGPLAATQSVQIHPYYFAAYRKIYDEYYRDQNLEVAELFVPLVAGDNSSVYGPGAPSVEQGNPQLRAIEHDYFSSCLPFAQKGDPVMLPLVFSAGVPVTLQTPDGTPGLILDADDGSVLTPGNVVTDVGGAINVSPDTGGAVYDPNGTLVVDIQSDAVTLDTLRTAIVLQEFLERDARGGTRYIEKIQAHYGVRSSDARLQRPEYIGGSKQVFAISEVLSTAQSSNDPATATQFVGQMAGHGLSVGGGNTFTYRAEEFGCIIGIISVLPEPAYQQGIHRSWFKEDAIGDFAWPAFANLGEQVVTIKELYAQAADVDLEFGYQSRYAEYKSIPSRVAGEFRNSLSFWHMGFDFATEPALNNDFIKANPSKYNRIFAVDAEESNQIYARIVNKIVASRRLPRFGIPSFGSVSAGQ